MDDQAVAALLAQMHDVHTPSVSPWPALGWWLVALLVLVLLAVFVWLIRRFKNRKIQLWHSQVQDELASLRQQIGQQTTTTILARCSRLARQLVLMCKPRESVASLHSEAWLKQLDDLCQQPLFTQGHGRLLHDQAYKRDPQVPEADLHTLVDAMDTLFVAVRKQAPTSGRLAKSKSMQIQGAA